jgi:SAM-dependent methyltransferase
MRRAIRPRNPRYTLCMQSASVTRGHGLLEHFLSRKRAAMADALIGDDGPRGRILDIGCGSFPLFLEQARFREKFGIDQLVNDVQKDEWARRSVILIQWDFDREPVLPFPDDHFDVVTMLAVLEHIEKPRLVPMVSEIHRVLRPGGIYVLTTPAWWIDPILLILSRLLLLSHAEIDEHKETHTRKSIAKILFQAGFLSKSVTTGSFEWGMNLWAKATKTS